MDSAFEEWKALNAVRQEALRYFGARLEACMGVYTTWEKGRWVVHLSLPGDSPESVAQAFVDLLVDERQSLWALMLERLRKGEDALRNEAQRELAAQQRALSEGLAQLAKEPE